MKQKSFNLSSWAFIVSLVALYISSNVLFIDRAMISVKDFGAELKQGDEGPELWLSYKIVNYGKAAAEDVMFDIYVMSIDNDRIAGKQWSDGIAGTIFPGAPPYPFGVDIIKPCSYDIGEGLAWVFDFNYKDTLFGKKNTQVWFKYEIGDDSISFLLESDRNKVGDKYKELKFSKKDGEIDYLGVFLNYKAINVSDFVGRIK